MARLTIREQRKLMKALPASRMAVVRSTCHTCKMRGEGIKEASAKVKKVLGSLAKEFGPLILRELVLPLLKQQIAKRIGGTGLKLAGQGLSLAGQGSHPKKKRKAIKKKK